MVPVIWISLAVFVLTWAIADIWPGGFIDILAGLGLLALIAGILLPYVSAALMKRQPQLAHVEFSETGVRARLADGTLRIDAAWETVFVVRGDKRSVYGVAVRKIGSKRVTVYGLPYSAFPTPTARSAFDDVVKRNCRWRSRLGVVLGR